MKLIDNYYEQLKKCLTINDISNMMNTRVYPKSDKSKFEDDFILLPTSTKYFNKLDLSLDNKFLEVALKLFIFLKLDGYLGLIPRGSGKISYVTDLRYIFKIIEKYQPRISSFQDISSNTFELFIDSYYKENNKKEFFRGYSKLYKLLEVCQYANNYLPVFLEIDSHIITKGRKFSQFKIDYKNEVKKKNNHIGKTKPYDLSKLKLIMEYAINYLEKNHMDGIIATEMYIKTKNGAKKGTPRHIYAYNLIKSCTHSFNDEKLKNLREKVINTSSPCIKKEGHSINKVVQTLIESSEYLEACCTIILLLTTGMRKSELILMNRYPQITNDEFYNLTRVIYKTSNSENGFKHEMPIPKISKKAIEVLSRISELKDGKSKGNLIVGSISGEVKANANLRIKRMINIITKEIKIDVSPNPHQFRHSMAFLIAKINVKDGLELARLFLGHSNISMTLQYMGHYNYLLSNAIKELNKKESFLLVNKVINEIEDGRKLYGEKGERLTENYQFKGSYAEKFTDLLNKSLLDLIEKGKLIIIQTDVCLCMHDLTKPEEMLCQRGFNIQNFIGENPKSFCCEGARCSNAIFTEAHIEKLEVGYIDERLKKRLEKNIFFIESGGFKNEPFLKMINKYKDAHRKGEAV
ncbi:site-specific integrase [Aliarcobacter butzleri]|uniref:site-specific integrase n=1 Tax=Aliarcobacter butzleri TaxID=28197 RepID=UPI001EDB233D|nr:site-specific integrase [Aliarcobacter butzleri]MCG3684521.1 site-specific integrase [Aliarcobacter butzleri]